MRVRDYERSHAMPHSTMLLTLSWNYNTHNRNERKRAKRAFKAQFTRRQWNEMHQGEVNRRNREKGLNRYGSPIKKVAA